MKNQYPQPHYQIANGQIVRVGCGWRVHHGNDGVDVQLSECSPTEWSTLEGTSTQLAFDVAAAAIWGTTYSSLATGYKAGMKQLMDAGLP